MIKGKIPPQAKDLEQAVLGALMIDKRAIDDTLDILNGEMFYDSKHEIIYNAIKSLYAVSSNIDLMTVTHQLEKSGDLEKSGGTIYLIELTQAVASTAHIEFHARIIIEKYIQRKLIENANTILENAYSEQVDVFDLIDNAYSSLNSVSEQSIRTQDAVLSTLIDTQIERAKKIYKGEIKAGIETPITRLTAKTGGFRDSELIILAARPGMGKTAFVLKVALESAKKNIPIAVFSLEMSKEKLTDRLLSMEARVDSDKFNIHGLSEYDLENVEKVRGYLKALPLHIDDNASLTITQFQIKAKRLKNKYDVKMIIVDYLQLMVGKGNNREQEISKISRGLKMTAKELNIPIIALSQLSRSVETRGGSKRPLLSDLRESGAIEQDADMVMFLFRPEYYGITEWDDYDADSTDGQCEYIVAKNRNGGLVRNRMKFEGRFTLFSNLEADEVEKPFDIDSSDDDMPF